MINGATLSCQVKVTEIKGRQTKEVIDCGQDSCSTHRQHFSKGHYDK